MRLADLELRLLHVNERTNWAFVRLRTDAGVEGLGEASLNGYEPQLTACLAQLRPRLIGMPLDGEPPVLATYPHAPEGLVGHAVRSAVWQAIIDAKSRAEGVPAWRLLGGLQRDRMRLYANINRSTRDRSPAGCAAAAAGAISRGFDAVKIAPFDGVLPLSSGGPESSLVEAGIARVRAMREAIGPGPRLMVDCHWRFDAPTAHTVLERLAEIGISWFECPISEQPTAYAALRRLRDAARTHGILVAACELQTSVAGFRPFVDGACVDAVMPDVKYCGGPLEMLRIAAYAQDHGVRFSPHNPTGPVCTMASLHVALAAGDVDCLELQLGESALTDDVAGGAMPAVVDGTFLVPTASGWGITLDDAVLDAHPYQPVQSGLDERLG